MPVIINAVATAQHQHRLLRHLPHKSETRRNIPMWRHVQAGKRCPKIAVGQRPFEIRRERESAERARRRDRSFRCDLLVEVRQQPLGLRGRAEDFVAHAFVQGQPRRQLHVVLLKTREVGVALIPPEDAATCNAGADIAQAEGAPVLRGALAEKKVVKGANLQKTIDFFGSVVVHLMTLHLGTQPHVVSAARQRQRVLPHERIRHLPERRRTGIADGESADGQPKCIEACSGRSGRRAFAQRSRRQRILNRRRSVEAHVAKARDVHQVRVEDVRVGEHEHRVAAQFVRSPTGHIRRIQ